ncbi:hypothetical protein [Rhizobium calliandrae]|uniref:hypothetical protein n=1 Tax=Rhizobium calliandrae TaxID=1312182 RepID=UPI003D80A79F
MLETFVFAEVLKLTSGGTSFEFSRFRDKQRNEVDIVIEVKSGSVRLELRFLWIANLAEASGEKFVSGLVLCDHQKVIPFGGRLYAVPFPRCSVSALELPFNILSLEDDHATRRCSTRHTDRREKLERLFASDPRKIDADSHLANILIRLRLLLGRAHCSRLFIA